jgi:hypothetical protein
MIKKNHNMDKKYIDSILLANRYFINCKIENLSISKTELARKYLLNRVKSALNEINSYQANIISNNIIQS